MKLSEAAELCDANSRAFAEVYKIYNFKDDDDLRGYCEFVIHEPAEWMRGFPAKWKSVGQFGRPRASFHKLMKHSAVVSALGAEFCHRVHETVWDAFKSNMDAILVKRNEAHAEPVANILEAFGDEAPEVVSEADADSTGIDSDAESLPPTTIRRTIKNDQAPVNAVAFTVSPMDYKRKYTATLAVLQSLLSAEGDENARLRAALLTLLSELESA